MYERTSLPSLTCHARSPNARGPNELLLRILLGQRQPGQQVEIPGLLHRVPLPGAPKWPAADKSTNQWNFEPSATGLAVDEPSGRRGWPAGGGPREQVRWSCAPEPLPIKRGVLPTGASQSYRR
jgi:hypothetical protein